MRRLKNYREVKRRDFILVKCWEAALNRLIFDEANHIDIPTMTILEDYLNSFQGIVITNRMTAIFWTT